MSIFFASHPFHASRYWDAHARVLTACGIHVLEELIYMWFLPHPPPQSMFLSIGIDPINIPSESSSTSIHPSINVPLSPAHTSESCSCALYPHLPHIPQTLISPSSQIGIHRSTPLSFPTSDQYFVDDFSLLASTACVVMQLCLQPILPSTGMTIRFADSSLSRACVPLKSLEISPGPTADNYEPCPSRSNCCDHGDAKSTVHNSSSFVARLHCHTSFIPVHPSPRHLTSFSSITLNAA